MISTNTVQTWKELFDEVNNDPNEDFVPFSDIEFYAQQIHNLTNEEDYETAHEIAVALSTF